MFYWHDFNLQVSKKKITFLLIFKIFIRIISGSPPWSVTFSWWWGFVHWWPKRFLKSGG